MDGHAGGDEGGDAAGPAWLVSEMLTDRLKLQRLNAKHEKENKTALELKRRTASVGSDWTGLIGSAYVDPMARTK